MPRTTRIIDGLLGVFKSLNDPNESPEQRTKAKDLLAFRTIITMLSHIQSPNIQSSTNTPIGTSGDDRRELRVLDALSTVLIRQHEIIAVVARPYDGSSLQVFASVVHPSNAEPLSQPGVDPGDQSFWDRVCNFTAAMNPRISKINNHSDSLINTTSLPIIENHENRVPGELVNAAKENVSVLEIFLQTHW